jgi:hypothetical protein
MRASISVVDEFKAMAIAYVRAVSMDKPMQGSFEKLTLAESIARDAQSIGAEMVVARYLGIKNFEPTYNTFKNSADVGAKFEVKWTKWGEGSLIIKPNDRDQDIAILVVGASPTYTLCGWIPVAIAKKPKYANSRGDSYWVGQQDLRPMDTLRGVNNEIATI